jgi:hypothetical protein
MGCPLLLAASVPVRQNLSIFDPASPPVPSIGWFASAISWFVYSPLTEKTFARGPATDYGALGLIASGVGTLTAAVNFIATILGLRAPGRALNKISASEMTARVEFLVSLRPQDRPPPRTAAAAPRK